MARCLQNVVNSAAREEFQFVDSLEPLRSSEQISKDLDDRLAAELLQQPASQSNYITHILEFAPPDEVRIEEVEDIVVVNGNKSAVMELFMIEALRAALNEVGVRRGVTFLKGIRLVARGADGDELSQLLPLRNWLVYEVGDAVSRYVLTLGRWFRLQEEYSSKLNADLKKIQDVTASVNLPDTTAKEHEAPYNSRAAEAPDLVLMDLVKIKTEDGIVVEACDLLHRAGNLIHVKRYNGSQTLSHLFSQGAVSAELLNGDPVMKKEFITEVADRDPSFESTAKDAPVTVTYAIAITDKYDLPLDLPTFSKVNLRDFAKRLIRMKVKPTLARIRVV